MKTKTFLSLIGAILLVACIGNASPFAGPQCSTIPFASIATLEALTFGCEAGNMIFSNFGASGAPSTMDANITATNGASPYPTAYAVNVSNSAGDLTTSFTFTYTVSEDPNLAPSTEYISSIGAGLQADGSGVSSLVKTVPGYGSITVTANGSGTTTTVPLAITGNATSVNVTDTFTQGSGGTLNFSNTYQDTIGPEPSTMLLMGGALIGLAGIARRKATRKS